MKSDLTPTCHSIQSSLGKWFDCLRTRGKKVRDEMIEAHWGKVHTRAHVEASTPEDRAEELRQELLGRLDDVYEIVGAGAGRSDEEATLLTLLPDEHLQQIADNAEALAAAVMDYARLARDIQAAKTE